MPDGREDSPSTLGKGRVVVFGNTERPAATEPVVPCADDPLIGCILRDTYRIVASLDEGGMGKLYRAEHLRLRRPVAVKFMARTLVTNPEALARFRREAEIISQLEHPHIVHILDFDATTAGEPYIVMELLSGMTLTERMAESPSVPLREAVEIALQISSGLTLAHASGIVHRDLKPDNVFLLSMTDKRVFVKLLDFGISMGNAAAARLTGKFDVLGTPDYMAPEQALDSSRTDHRADQWSLACLVYEMLAGRPPFTGDSVVELLRNVVHENPISLVTYATGVPTEVESVVLRGLSKDPDQRYSCIAELAESLAAAANVALLGDSEPAVSNSGKPVALRHSKPTRVDGKGKGIETGDSAQRAKPPKGSDQPAAPSLRSTQPDGGNRGRIRRYSNSKFEGGARPQSDRRSIEPRDAASGSSNPASVQALFDQLSRAIAFADEPKSLELARSVIKQVQTSHSADARRALGAAADQLVVILLRALGRPDCVLRLNSSAPTSQDASMSPQHMFLLSRIVNRMTIDELLDITPLSRLDTLSMVLDFQDRGYLSIE